MPSILEQGEQHVKNVVASKPSQFTVGAYKDGRTKGTSITFDRKWSNGFGLTAYALAWWRDASVTPLNEPTSDVKIGGEGSYRF